MNNVYLSFLLVDSTTEDLLGALKPSFWCLACSKNLCRGLQRVALAGCECQMTVKVIRKSENGINLLFLTSLSQRDKA